MNPFKFPKKVWKVGDKVDSAFGRFTSGIVKSVHKSWLKRTYLVEWGNGCLQELEGDKLRRQYKYGR